jgi:hypothetical protein
MLVLYTHHTDYSTSVAVVRMADVAALRGRLAKGERNPAIECGSGKPVLDRDGRTVQKIEPQAGRGRAGKGVPRSGTSAGMGRGVNRRAALSLRHPAEQKVIMSR